MYTLLKINAVQENSFCYWVIMKSVYVTTAQNLKTALTK